MFVQWCTSLILSILSIEHSDSGAGDLTVALDQNRFLEEHNTHLQSTLNETKQKLQTLQESHAKLCEEHKTTSQLLRDIQTENDLYRSENNRLTSEFDRKLQVGCFVSTVDCFDETCDCNGAFFRFYCAVTVSDKI